MIPIDAHQHFWNPLRRDYGWMPENDPTLSRLYTPADLASALVQTGVEKTILVQAAPTVAETDYLLGIADATPHVAKVVGWINFEDSTQITTLERFAAHPKFSGVRPMIQDIADPHWMLRDDVQWAYRALIELDLTFDCLGFPQHLQAFHTLLMRYPDMRTVIDHCMKPQFRNHSEENYKQWRDGITRLAGETRACCKLSGLVTEADTDWSIPVLKPYTDHVINEFSASRVMWGSDWPVVRLRCEYEDWYQMARHLTSDCTVTDQDQLFGGTAADFYRL